MVRIKPPRARRARDRFDTNEGEKVVSVDRIERSGDRGEAARRLTACPPVLALQMLTLIKAGPEAGAWRSRGGS